MFEKEDDSLEITYPFGSKVIYGVTLEKPLNFNCKKFLANIVRQKCSEKNCSGLNHNSINNDFTCISCIQIMAVLGQLYKVFHNFMALI